MNHCCKDIHPTVSTLFRRLYVYVLFDFLQFNDVQLFIRKTNKHKYLLVYFVVIVFFAYHFFQIFNKNSLFLNKFNDFSVKSKLFISDIGSGGALQNYNEVQCPKTDPFEHVR